MSDFKVLSYNVRGLSSPFKCSRVWRQVHSLRPQVLMLQETRFMLGSVPKLPLYLFDRWFQSTSPIKQAKGVAIALHKTCLFFPETHLEDPEGRYVIIKGTLYGNPLTLLNIYAPNFGQVSFLEKVQQFLHNFSSGSMIVGSDFNVCLDPQLDSSASKSCTPLSVRKRIARSLRNLRLVDCWRVLHTNKKDYSYFPSVRQSYCRIDLLLIV